MPFYLLGTLITVFLFVLGPVNWMFVRKLGTRLFFVVTIPAISAAAMVVFFSGAVAFEGIGRRCSTRSITWLNQANGTAASWSHQSYYSTFPLKQLSYPASTFATPLATGRSWRWSTSVTYAESDGNTQAISSSLRARNFSLWRIGTLIPTQRRLAIQPAGPNRIAMRNALGVRIKELVIRDANGTYYAASELKPNERRKLSPIGSPEVAVHALRDVYQEIVGASGTTRPGLRSLATGAGDRAPFLEQQCEAAFRTLAIPKSHYIAISTTTPSFVPLGATGTRPTPDVSIIIGQW